MIIIRDRKLYIPENERLIGYVGDNKITIRQFEITESFLFDFDFSIDLKQNKIVIGTIPLTKIINIDTMILTWEILKEHLSKMGVIEIQLRAFNSNNDLVWHSAIDSMRIYDSVNADATILPVAETAFAIQEQRITTAKNETLAARDAIIDYTYDKAYIDALLLRVSNLETLTNFLNDSNYQIVRVKSSNII